MSADVPVRRGPHLIRPDHRRTVVRTFMPGDSPNAIEAEQTRAQRIIARVLSLPEDDLSAEYSRLLTVLCGRHRDVEKVFLQRYENTRELLGGGFLASGTRARLIGAYFSEEYSYQSAALFNPSIVMHPEQSGCAPRSLRFILSLRAIGEGHLSSIAFRTGSWRPGGDIVLDAASRLAATPRIEFQETEDGVVHLHCEDSHHLSETVLFPILERQRGGIEDLRLTRLHREAGSMLFAGTYRGAACLDRSWRSSSDWCQARSGPARCAGRP